MNISKAQQIHGWMSDAELMFLAEVASRSFEILEVGSFHGRSTRALCDNTSGRVTAVDPWSGTYYNDDNSIALWIDTKVFNKFEQNLRDHFESGRLTAIVGTIISVPIDAKYDFIFLDGDHRYESVVYDINCARTLLKPGGILAGHDYRHSTWPGVKRAVNELVPDAKIVDSIWWKNF